MFLKVYSCLPLWAIHISKADFALANVGAQLPSLYFGVFSKWQYQFIFDHDL